jgi:hypothetical protein
MRFLLLVSFALSQAWNAGKWGGDEAGAELNKFRGLRTQGSRLKDSRQKTQHEMHNKAQRRVTRLKTQSETLKISKCGGALEKLGKTKLRVESHSHHQDGHARGGPHYGGGSG